MNYVEKNLILFKNNITPNVCKVGLNMGYPETSVNHSLRFSPLDDVMCSFTLCKYRKSIVIVQKVDFNICYGVTWIQKVFLENVSISALVSKPLKLFWSNLYFRSISYGCTISYFETIWKWILILVKNQFKIKLFIWFVL